MEYPEYAITKRYDGVVLIEAQACSGCMTCVEACPFGVIQFDAEKGATQKCTLCGERLDVGRRPACVSPTEIAEKIGDSQVWLWYKDKL